MKRFLERPRVLGAVALLTLVLAAAYSTNLHLLARYEHLESPATEDRTGVVLSLGPNEKGAYVRYDDTLPDHVKKLLVQKEDRFFYYHFGINPISTVRAVMRHIVFGRSGGASTITQQLAKNLLGNEQNRSLLNKLTELFGATSLELFNSKETILAMYTNSVYMGNQVQGLHGASNLYFGADIAELDDTKLMMLLTTISSPSTQNPWREENARTSRNLALRLGIEFDPAQATIRPERDYAPPRNFELASMHQNCAETCRTTIDADLTERLRAILKRHVDSGYSYGARSGAIVVISLPENELLAIVGTPYPASFTDGAQINMAVEPRAIGSTAKPFIYLTGFEEGLRPYTLVNDREYKFPIGSGFPLYPKNYDGSFSGWVTLHAALSNSLNIPTVKVLQHVGLANFYDFLEQRLGFMPLQDLDTYQYGIALGALEVDPLTLAHFFTIFPQKGELKPLKLFVSGTSTPYINAPMSRHESAQKITDPALAALVTKVLNDRLSGVEQFGLASSLNLSRGNYAVKTGTSQDYHDSWTVGYTPDFLVAVWYGNPDNTPLKRITGQMGAGAIWHETMELLMNSPYDRRTPFDFSDVSEFTIDDSVDFGLIDDVVAEHRDLLPDSDLIMSPQEGDAFMFDARMTIPLVSQESVLWYANGEYIGEGMRAHFRPSEADDYEIKAVTANGQSARVRVHVTPLQ